MRMHWPRRHSHKPEWLFTVAFMLATKEACRHNGKVDADEWERTLDVFTDYPIGVA